MFCPNCGNQVIPNTAYCSNCGANISATQNSNPVNNLNNNAPITPNNNNNIVKIICILLVVIAIIAVGFYAVNSLKDNNKNNDNEVVDDNDKNDTVKTYNVGDAVTLVDGSNWYVMSQEDDIVTLFSSENYGEPTYFSNSTNYYENSIVKDIIENQFLPSLKTSLSENGGDVTDLKARIISVDDIRELLNISSSVENTSIEIERPYNWLYGTGSYWTSTHSGNELHESVYIVEDWNSFAVINEDIAGLGLSSGNKFNIRPVIETTTKNIK